MCFTPMWAGSSERRAREALAASRHRVPGVSPSGGAEVTFAGVEASPGEAAAPPQPAAMRSIHDHLQKTRIPGQRSSCGVDVGGIPHPVKLSARVSAASAGDRIWQRFTGRRVDSERRRASRSTDSPDTPCTGCSAWAHSHTDWLCTRGAHVRTPRGTLLLDQEGAEGAEPPDGGGVARKREHRRESREEDDRASRSVRRQGRRGACDPGSRMAEGPDHTAGRRVASHPRRLRS
ncbi:uncharacterized protein CMC5_032730 [Chondromyces crocatus]|uniref:Uncharacterized protein n=1 Tax=Chondromyces crocatus TaxID=52 RepID=A0A0K1EE36_CHOCO|nr:uncharacterized protein CMC5_032730 [Chondromyces crocatus]